MKRESQGGGCRTRREAPDQVLSSADIHRMMVSTCGILIQQLASQISMTLSADAKGIEEMPLTTRTSALTRGSKGWGSTQGLIAATILNH